MHVFWNERYLKRYKMNLARPGDLCKISSGDIIREVVDGSDRGDYWALSVLVMKEEIWMYLTRETKSQLHTFLRPNGKKITVFFSPKKWQKLNWIER